jgi:hypothetical protein
MRSSCEWSGRGKGVTEMTERHIWGQSGWDLRLRWAAVFFVVALAVHTVDHLRRGMDVVAPAVMTAGLIQGVAAAITVVLVFRGSRWAPHAAILVGFASAVGFTAAHLLPTWGAFSDSFIDAAPAAGVTWFSWVTAILEILADLLFGAAGVAVLAARSTPRSPIAQP